jgi:glutamine synthetase
LVTLVQMAAIRMMLFKYIVKNIGQEVRQDSLTFMPKPLYGDNGSGMHVHQFRSGKAGRTLFAGKEYAGLSETALYFIGGLLKHAPRRAAPCSPAQRPIHTSDWCPVMRLR